MSKSEILAEISNLSFEDREEILARLWEMEEAEMDRGPGASEKKLLDNEAAQYAANSDPGSPWSEVEARLRRGE